MGAMQTVKAARFNAAERLERKHLVSVFALSTVSLYFVGLSVWQTVYAANLEAPTNQLITLVSIMSSICTLVLALIDSMNDYKIKAHHMHACALVRERSAAGIAPAADERSRHRAGLPSALQRDRARLPPSTTRASTT